MASSTETFRKTIEYAESGIFPNLEAELGLPLPLDSVRLSQLPSNQLGLTVGGYDASKVYLNSGLYSAPFFGDLRDFEGVDAYAPEADIAKYMQLHPLSHELVHGALADSGYEAAAIRNLANYGLDEFEITGFLEMYAEKKTIDAYLAAGEFDLAATAYSLSPYKGALDLAYQIDSSYSGGFDGFMAEIVGTPLSPGAAFLEGLDVGYSAFSPSASYTCGGNGCA